VFNCCVDILGLLGNEVSLDVNVSFLTSGPYCDNAVRLLLATNCGAIRCCCPVKPERSLRTSMLHTSYLRCVV
jgi:hypothetical protein